MVGRSLHDNNKDMQQVQLQSKPKSNQITAHLNLLWLIIIPNYYKRHWVDSWEYNAVKLNPFNATSPDWLSAES